MPTVRSADGTAIAHERLGTGAPLVLVDGALGHRASLGGRALAALLADRFTVHLYDRRGRGDSAGAGAGAEESSVGREVEDLAAVIGAAGGPVSVYGTSSGAALALHAAAAGLPISRLAVHEPPLAPHPRAHAEQRAALAAIRAALAEDRNGEAVRLFLRLVGTSPSTIALLRLTPLWRRLTAVAPTLPHDLAALGADDEQSTLVTLAWERIGMPTLVLAGARSAPDLLAATRRIAASLTDATHDLLEGPPRRVGRAVLAPVLAEFFDDEVDPRPRVRRSGTAEPAHR